MFLGLLVYGKVKSVAINIASGTGSIALGKDSKGKTIRCGGWGDYIGDEGYAYWIGKKLLRCFQKKLIKELKEV